jgi:hypothetical protein
MPSGTLWNPDDRQIIVRRFTQLSPGSRPKWGRLDAPRMLTHVTDALRSGLGEVEVTPLKGPLAYWPLNSLVMFYLPWPKGAPTAPELLSRTPADWTRDVDLLSSAVDRFVARGIDGDFARHVAFGVIDGRAWGRLMHRHMDYHLRQFGG